jgi:hypothetical protein
MPGNSMKNLDKVKELRDGEVNLPNLEQREITIFSIDQYKRHLKNNHLT